MKRSAWCLLVAMVAIAGCGDKPKPKDEFTMAAPCDTGAETAPKGTPAPAPR